MVQQLLKSVELANYSNLQCVCVLLTSLLTLEVALSYLNESLAENNYGWSPLQGTLYPSMWLWSLFFEPRRCGSSCLASLRCSSSCAWSPCAVKSQLDTRDLQLADPNWSFTYCNIVFGVVDNWTKGLIQIKVPRRMPPKAYDYVILNLLNSPSSKEWEQNERISDYHCKNRY